MRIVFTLFTLIFFLGLNQAFGQTTQASTQPTTQPTTQSSTSDQSMMEEVVKNTEEYEITYPAEWVFDDSGMMGTKFLIFSPQTSATDSFKENINYITQDISAFNLDLDEYVKLSTDQIAQFINNANHISSEKETDKNGNSFHRLEYTGDQGVYKLHFLQHIYVENGNAQIITFTAEQDQFNNYKDLAERIIGTMVRK